MSFKDTIKKLAKAGATTIAAGLNLGLGGGVGKIAGSMLSKALNVEEKSSAIAEKLESMLGSEEGRAQLKKMDLDFKLNMEAKLNERELSELNAEIRFFEEAQLSYRAELDYGAKTGDTFVSHTRPLIIRQLFKLAKVMVYSLISAFVLDVITDWILIRQCGLLTWTPVDYDSNVTSLGQCMQFVKDRVSFSVRISVMYKDNWVWLSPLFGIFMTWFGGRTWEKRHDRED